MAKHLDLLNRMLVQVSLGIITRLIVSMPPRHGKSEMCSKYLPTWFLGLNPDKRVILTAYEADFAAEWGRKVRNELQAYGKQLFGVSVSSDSRAADRWNIEGHQGGMVTSGVGGAITGRGCELLVIDDPVKNAEEAGSETIRDAIYNWYQSTARTRLQPGASCVVIQTRWHQDDLAGRLIARSDAGGEHWDVLTMPAIAEQDEHWPDGSIFRKEGEVLWEDHFPAQVLASTQSSMTPYWWNALYQQSPGQHERAEWPAEYFEGDDLWFDEWPTHDHIWLKGIALDPSKGKTDRSDYSAFVMIAVTHDGTLHVQADLARRPVDQIVQVGCDLYSTFRPDGFSVEANAWQDLLAGEFKREFERRGNMPPWINLPNNNVNKIVRIRRLGQYLSTRRMKFKANCPGTELLFKQLKEFPTAKYDDGPDACEQCVQLLESLSQGDAEQYESYGLAVP
jgi:hypothetical protein